MYNLSMDESLLIAKIFASVMGDSSVKLTELDKDAAKNLIKRIADQRYDWSLEQKEKFKFFVDAIV